MFLFPSPFMVLLSFVGVHHGNDFETCEYNVVTSSSEYALYSFDYTSYHREGSGCRWILESDRPMKLSCNSPEIPFSNDCGLALTIHDSEETVGRRYCAGNGNISFVSRSNKLVVKIATEAFLPGGEFLCTVTTAESSDDGDDCNCGRTNHGMNLKPRIVGGEETGINEYPMMSGLYDSRIKMIFCGATIINERQVITAAHCLKAKRVDEIKVLVGGHHLSEDTEAIPTKLCHVESYTIHPLYDDATQDYDIAVVTMVNAMTFDQEVGPVCLPFQHSEHTFDGASVEVLGWGSTEFAGSPSNTLQKARLSVASNAACSRTYKEVSTRQLCTHAPDRDSCQFDSGGPVLWQNPRSRRIVGVGIISWGSVCGDGELAVNTRLGGFIDWIMSKTPPGIRYCRLE